MSGLLSMVLAAALATQAAPAATQAAPAAAGAAQRVSLPFNPPLDRPLRYRLTRTIPKPSGTVTARLDYEISFSRQGEGLRMTVRTANFDFAPAAPEVMARVRPFVLELLQPFSLRLDAEGEILELEDADGYTERMFATAERRARELGGADPAMLAFISGIGRTMTAEQKLNALTMYIAPLLEFAATELALGETLTSEIDSPPLFGAGTFRQHATILPQRIEGDLLHIRVQSTVPAEETRRALLAAMDAVPVTGEGRNTAEQRARTREELSGMEFTRETEDDYAVETATGLTRRHRSAQSATVRTPRTNVIQTETRVLERSD
jgi:hypothetical protein